MSQQLSPNESFVINRILKDHMDTDTHYVRAVVYDSVTRAVLSTLDLTDNGNRWFSKAFKVPYGDTFSIGRHILIITTVYDDSGYTSKSPNYAEESEEYLIQQRWSPTLAGAGSGGIDYREIAKVVKEIVDNRKLQEIKFPEQKIPEPIDIESLKKDILNGVDKKIDRIIGSIPNPEKPEKVDLRSLENGLEKIIKEIKSQPKFEKTDFSELARSISQLISEIRTINSNQKSQIIEYFEKFKTEVLDSITDENAKLKFINGIKDGSIRFNEPLETKKRNAYLQNLANKYR